MNLALILFADMKKILVKTFRIEDDKFILISPSIPFIIGRGGVSGIEQTRKGTILVIDCKFKLFFTAFRKHAMANLWEWIGGQTIECSHSLPDAFYWISEDRCDN